VISEGSPTALVNGKNTRLLDVADRGLHYGDGIFTTLPVQEGVAIFLDRHLKRLQADALRLNIPFPGFEILTEEVQRIGHMHSSCVLKIMLTRGVGGRGYLVPKQSKGTRILSSHPKPDYPKSIRESGVTVRFCDIRLGLNPHLAGIKHLNRLEQVLARAEWGDEGIREGLMLDHEGFLVEGVMSNVFLVSNGVLRTPVLERCGVAGVMRGLVLESAALLGLTVEEERILPEEAHNADEIFLTNSIIGVWPVTLLDGKKFSVGNITRLLTRRIDDMVTQELEFRSLKGVSENVYSPLRLGSGQALQKGGMGD